MYRARKLNHIQTPMSESPQLSDDQLEHELFRSVVPQQALTAHTPTSGLGRFHAKYDVNANRLDVSVKFKFSFVSQPGSGSLPGGKEWTGERISAWKQRFFKVIEDTWSERYTIACSRPGWEKYYANVFVKGVEDTMNPDYTLEIKSLAPGNTAGQMVSADTRQGYLLDSCVEIDMTGQKRDVGAFKLKFDQVQTVIENTGVTFLPFAKNSALLDTGTRMALTGFVTKAQSVITKEFIDGGFHIHVYGKAGTDEGGISNLGLGKKRAKAVAELINERFRVKNLALVVESSDKEPWVTAPSQELMRKAKFSEAAIRGRSFNGVMLMLKPIDQKKPQGMQRNYYIAAHEFGHMIGLPDEYFGIQDHGLQKVADPRSIIPDTYRMLTQTVSKPDARRGVQAAAMAKMIAESGAPSPLFINSMEVATTSIMYAGGDVLPAHYLTLWEALCKMTFPFLGPQHWKIVPNKAGEGKKSELKHFQAIGHSKLAS